MSFVKNNKIFIDKNKIKNAFTRGAHTYDSAADLQRKVATDLFHQHQDFISAQSADIPNPTHPSNFKSILEIGCGTGLLSELLINYYQKAEFILLDFSEAMIETVKQRFAYCQENTSHVKTLCLDAEQLSTHLPFTRYDLVLSSMTFHWFNQLHNSINKILSRVNEGGYLFFSLVGNDSLKEWHEVCDRFNANIGIQYFPKLAHLQSYFPQIKYIIKTYQQEHSSAFQFLKSLKNLGAQATQSDYVKLSSGKLRKIMRYLDDQMPKPLKITYEIIYGIYKK